MAEFPSSDRPQILDTPRVKYPEKRMVHAPDCPWAFSPKKRRVRTYRDATPDEIRTHGHCSHC